MKRLALTFLATACSTGRESTPARVGEIFRYTAVGRSTALDSVVLGQPWTTAEKYGAQTGDTVNALPAGTFGGADAIRVHRDPGGIVTEIDFRYYASRDLNALLSDYRSSLGPPQSVTTDTVAGGVRTTTRWVDRNTEFTISTMRPPDKDDVAGIGVLRNRSP